MSASPPNPAAMNERQTQTQLPILLCVRFRKMSCHTTLAFRDLLLKNGSSNL